MNPVALTRIFERHTRLWHFWMRDLRSGEVIELGTRRAYPIGSCFKLAVLMAYFEALKDPAELDQPVSIPPERFRIGGGVINFLDSAVTLTWRQMLHLMLAASDGTCTDWLIARLGLPAVNDVMRRYAPDSHLACDLGDMVAAFRKIPGALDCKTRDFSDAELLAFVDATNSLGATHAEDLAALALAAWRHPGDGIGGGDALSTVLEGRAIPIASFQNVHRTYAFAVHKDRLHRTNIFHAGMRRAAGANRQRRDRQLWVLLGRMADAERNGRNRWWINRNRNRANAGTKTGAERRLHARGRGTAHGNAGGTGREDYERCLDVKRFNTRGGMFVSPAIRMFSKTGSLGGRFIMDDCGVLIDSHTKTEIAHFGYCSVGWRLPALTAETAGGFIGIEIARALGLEPVLNADYTPEGAALLLGSEMPP